MIQSLYVYTREFVLRDWRRLVFDPDLGVAALLILAVMCRWINIEPKQPITYQNLDELVLTYSAIAVGFLIAAMSLVLAVPNRDFTKWLVESETNQNKFRDLLFVFSFAALLHWLVIIVVLVMAITGASTQVIFPLSESAIDRIVPAVLLAFFAYAAMTLLSAIIALAFYADLNIRFVKGSGG